MSLNIYDIPKEIIDYILINFLSFKDLNSCLNTAKLFNLKQYQISQIKMNLSFHDCLIHGFVEECKIKSRVPNFSFDIHANNESYLINTCKKGYTDMVKWFFDIEYRLKKKFDILVLNNILFEYAFINGHFEIIKILYNKLKIHNDVIYAKNTMKNILQNNNFYICRKIIQNNHIEIFKWIISLFENNELHIIIDIVVDVCIKFDNLDIFQYLQDNVYISRLLNNNKYYKKLCKQAIINNSNKIFMHIYVYKGKTFNFRKNNDILFHLACENNCFETANFIWLYCNSIDNPIKLHAYDNRSIKYVCENNYYKIFKWLIDIAVMLDEPYDLHMDNDYLFSTACEKNYVDIAKLIYQNCFNKLTNKNHEFFKIACINNSLDIAKWLYEISKSDEIFIKEIINRPNFIYTFPMIEMNTKKLYQSINNINK